MSVYSFQSLAPQANGSREKPWVNPATWAYAHTLQSRSQDEGSRSMQLVRPDLVAGWKPRGKGRAARAAHGNKYSKPRFACEKINNFVYNQTVQTLLGWKKPYCRHALFLTLNRSFFLNVPNSASWPLHLRNLNTLGKGPRIIFCY